MAQTPSPRPLLPVNMMPIPRLVNTREFVELTKMDLTQFYLLYQSGKLPITEKKHDTYIDINDIRARQYLPDYKPNDLFK
jgi:hypothetical protein